ncbi:AAA family ATPase [Algibacter sp. L1A34]|uniref:AAA family ATPase n=1 Tax=Algibacter sp. L1A34 TaxID=2686365 RepID=UPI00131B8467|nr:AAA family ATPase [Algibacter sp. L1A34]
MKILKIELQNINSLKSDSSIVIDFESEQFKDVGLYAITGSTGAGKTTILDAVTIALYHNVPRFNGTKGSLINVVSHGAHDAFSRITFENDNVIYDAFWGMKVADKSGKKYKNPKEEVSLKNLTTGAILASQKRSLISEVVRVTQLDYNQFLRSVMLAQGEFASFLTAKGPEKGKLLEQITGEEIYKKIGQSIQERKAKEENALKDIQSRINSDDVLSEEAKVELTQKDKALDTEILKIEKEIKTTQSIVEWYVKFQKILDESEKLEIESKEVNLFVEKHKQELEQLDLNEKAAPFKELLQNLNRTEQESVDKSKQLERLESELKTLKPEIEKLSSQTQKETDLLNVADKTFADWLPKFDAINSLDGKLKNEAENKQKSILELEALAKQIKLLREEQTKLNKDLADTEAKIKIDQSFIFEHKLLKDVDLQISNWASELTALKAKKESLKEAQDFVSVKKEEVEKTEARLKEGNKLLKVETDEIEKTEKLLAEITLKLSKNNLTDLLATKTKLATKETNWKQFKTLSEQILKVEKEQTDLLTKQKALAKALEVSKKEIQAVNQQIEAQEKSVADADKILNLEKSISKYEGDRQSLTEGTPCGLCGSLEHPFTENLVSVGVSKSELELNKRKEKLQALIVSKNELEKKEVVANTTIDGLTQRHGLINDEVKALKLKTKQLNIDCELSNTAQIEIEVKQITQDILLLDKKLKVAQQLQKDSNKLNDTFKIQSERFNKIKNGVATLVEKNKNSNKDIAEKQKLIVNLKEICNNLEIALKEKLSKFNYQFPSIEKSSEFIESLKILIADFNKKEKNLDLLKSSISVVNTKLENNKEKLEIQLKAEEVCSKTITVSIVKIEQLKKQREAILPIAISVEQKRELLQTERMALSKKVEFSKQKRQEFLDLQNKKEALKIETNKEVLVLKEKLDTLNSIFDTQLKVSDFDTRELVQKAILLDADLVRFTKNKEAIKEKQLRLKAYRESNEKAKVDLEKFKTFEITEAECKLALEDLNKANKTLLSEKGEIIQAFKKDKEIRDRNKEIYKKIDAQETVCNVWRELFKIIGNSKDAFNVYVQRLTLKHLLDLANVHLFKLNKRYSLKMEEAYKPKEELNFNLIDHYQTDQARLIDTSSGGEKFIISLALALGLSDLASKNVKIDSLFIDEGFGTLDKNTLETVISTLETLQSQGKMIGIISHVENLKERISTQIQITKKNNGVSVVDIM